MTDIDALAAIRVNAVSPLSGETPILLRSGLPKEQQDGFLSQLQDSNPMKRLGRPGEIARAVAFLAFEAPFTTGHELPVDGGMTEL